MRTLVLALSAATLTVPALPAAPAFAHGTTTYHGKTWRGSDGRMYCRKPNGTTGLVVGGAAGALAGREIAGRGSRTTGTVLGAAVGALLGRHVQRNVISSRRRCR
ncbi:MAG TPA: glycine zipper 2TM domain-containing protein [Allosphingosinicella sp.]|nr:glycine zipper 2TM domain-containing protein [Allosphingosinicella sp.]